MALRLLDCLGLKCPQPILKVAGTVPEMKPGDVLEVTADCPMFPKDIQVWCSRAKKTLLYCRDEGNGKFRAQVQF